MFKDGDIVICVSEGYYNSSPYVGRRYRIISIGARSPWIHMECIDVKQGDVSLRLNNTFKACDFRKIDKTYLSNQGTEAWY